MLYKTLKHKTKPNTFGVVEVVDRFPQGQNEFGQLVHFSTEVLNVKEVAVPVLVPTTATLESITPNYSYFKAMQFNLINELFKDWEFANVKALINEL